MKKILALDSPTKCLVNIFSDDTEIENYSTDLSVKQPLRIKVFSVNKKLQLSLKTVTAVPVISQDAIRHSVIKNLLDVLIIKAYQ